MAKTLWVDTLINHDVTNNSQLLLSLVTGFTSEELRLASMTLMRTIVGFDIGYTVHDSGEGSQSIDIGIGVTSQEAFAANTVPDPNVDSDFPTRGWIFRARGRIFGFAADQPMVYSWRVDRDLRSRRKLENGECYVAFNNFSVEGVASTVRVNGLIRQLWIVS